MSPFELASAPYYKPHRLASRCAGPHRRRNFWRVAALASVIGLRPIAMDGQIPDHATNLRVLPTTLSRDSLVSTMRSMAGALGVQCGYCHAGKATPSLDSINFASDAKLAKRKAREMLGLVDRINADLDRILPGRGAKALRVSCITCHRASPRPVLLEDSLATAYATVGVDSTIGIYRALRASYYGRFSWDFGERSLNVLANRLTGDGHLADARTLLRVNAEFFPDSWYVAYLIGALHLKLGNRAAAMGCLQKVVTLLPVHPDAKQTLDSLMATPPPVTPSAC